MAKIGNLFCTSRMEKKLGNKSIQDGKIEKMFVICRMAIQDFCLFRRDGKLKKKYV